MKTSNRPALYTTVYPGGEKYLAAWYESVLAQTDRDFDLWIGVDGLEIDAVKTALGTDPNATWVVSDAGFSPAQIRQEAIRRMIDHHPIIVFVDSDDLLDPTRVEASVVALQACDVAGCAMRGVDEEGRETGTWFGPLNGTDPADRLDRTNVFGLSNSAYRSEMLRRCLPIPADCHLVDWYLITRAWASGARLWFDSTCRMRYRRHEGNMAPVWPPFTADRVRLAVERVLNHYECVLVQALGPEPATGELSQDLALGAPRGSRPAALPNRETAPQSLWHRRRVEMAQRRAAAFQRAILRSDRTMNRYVQALNASPPEPVWWSCVADPRLEAIWNGR